MANGRKPAPTYASVGDQDDSEWPQETQENDTQNITRYTLTDAPYPSSYHGSEYDSQYDSQYDHVIPDSQRRLTRTSPLRNPTLPSVPEATEESTSAGDRSSISKDSVSSGLTYVDQDQLYSDPRNYVHKVPYSQQLAGQNTLPTITSGEPLDWEDYRYQSNEDPFADGNSSRLAQGTRPHHTYVQSGSDHSHALAKWQHPSRPASAYSALSAALQPDQTGYIYQPEELETSYTGSYGTVDHFRHDTEAYASGTYSRASYRPPRSRSPTPAVDDEDYHIVGNDSVHYTGYSPQRQSQSHDYEKVALQQQDISHPQTHSHHERTLGYEGQDEHLYPDPEKKSLSSTGSPYPEPETPVNTRHFGPAPSGRILRRHKTKKRVQLTNGNLVVNMDVPPSLVLPRKGEPEMMKMRYTAVTCDPDEFEKNGFFLRQNESGRTTELFIVITMFNVCPSNYEYH